MLLLFCGLTSQSTAMSTVVETVNFIDAMGRVLGVGKRCIGRLGCMDG